MKKVSIGVLVLLVCLCIGWMSFMIVSSFSYQEEGNPITIEKTVVKKCTYPAGVAGVIEVGNPPTGYILWVTGSETTITVLEEVTYTSKDESGEPFEVNFYRFSGSYDKPDIACEEHEKHSFDEVKTYVPPEAIDRFLLPVKIATCN